MNWMGVCQSARCLSPASALFRCLILLKWTRGSGQTKGFDPHLSLHFYTYWFLLSLPSPVSLVRWQHSASRKRKPSLTPDSTLFKKWCFGIGQVFSQWTGAKLVPHLQGYFYHFQSFYTLLENSVLLWFFALLSAVVWITGLVCAPVGWFYMSNHTSPTRLPYRLIIHHIYAFHKLPWVKDSCGLSCFSN